MSEAPLTDAEIRSLRTILKGLSGAEWRALKAISSGIVNAMGNGQGSPSNGGGGSSSGGRGDELPDHFLDSQPWTDKLISKDPKRWAGQPMVGYRYSEAPSEWHDVMADQFEWKAEQGRKESPPRLQERGKNKGKPWHEADAFEAKVCRAWSRRNKGKALPPATPANGSAPAGDGGGGEAEETYTPTGAGADDDIPF